MLALIPVIGPVVALLLGIPLSALGAGPMGVLTPYGAVLIAALF